MQPYNAWGPPLCSMGLTPCDMGSRTFPHVLWYGVHLSSCTVVCTAKSELLF